jgi:TetR/AcrR family transcriptional regulator, transcriptional repressor for nem operon
MPKPSLREALLDAGLAELHEHGYAATGVAAIAERAGAPKGSFYNHFASKEEFAALVIGRYGDGRRLEMLTDSAVAPIERIRAHFAHLRADLAVDGFAHGCMFGNFAAEVAGTNERLRGVVGTALDAWASLLAGAIDEARRAGEVTCPMDSADAASLLIAAWEGAVLQAKAAGDPAALDNVLTFAFTVLLAPTHGSEK